MRVLAFCDYYHPDSCGGSERVAREVYERLAHRDGVELTVVGTVPSAWPAEPAGAAVTTVLVAGRDLSASVGAQLTVSRRLPAVASRLVREVRPDVLHANSLHFQGSLVAARLARRSGIPLVTTAHLGATAALPPRLRWPAAGWDRTLGRTVLRASRELVAVSDSVAAHLDRLGADPGRVSVAPNGVDHELFHARDRVERDAPLRVGFVGRLIANKGPQLALAAAAGCVARGVDLRVEFLGDGPLRSQLQQDADRLGLAGRVSFAGQVDDVAARLRRLDVVVRPSYTEGMPLAVIEAMACGAVVVASDIPGNTDLVAHELTGLLFPAGDVTALAGALRRLHDTPLLTEGLRRRGLHHARAFSWDRSAALHLHALARAAGHAPTEAVA